MSHIDPSASNKAAAPLPRFAKAPKKIEKKEYRKRRKGLTGNKVRYTLSTMPYPELMAAKDRCIASNQFETAAKYLERLITLCENSHEKADLIIEIADLLFSQNDFDAAKKWYQEFVRLYPGNKGIEKAKRSIILCTKQYIRSPDRDQTPTEETLKLAQEYLDKESFKTYREEVTAIKKECEAILAQADCGVAEFYITYGDYSAAERRIKHIRTAWLEKVPEVITTLAQLEVSLGTSYKEFSIPEESFKIAQNALPTKTRKVDMTTRF